MSQRPCCPDRDRLYQLIDCDLSSEETSKLEDHLSDCPLCRSVIDGQIHATPWWQNASGSLRDDDHEIDADDLQVDPHCDVMAMLGPTDDPTKLGRIAGYEIVGILGRGGMGVVFKGFDPPLNRFVAIKMLLPHLAASGAARKRFAREARAAAAVVDDYVMAIHSVEQWQGVPFLVMPYSRGVSLQRRLSDNGPLELKEILRIGCQAAKGLAAAHAQGLVHRDVKPANILLADGVERIMLTDFGLARAADDASLTGTGVLAGTPQYMSPEQTRAEPIDFRSDLFSLGSVLYALCTGRPPFRADSSYAILRLISDNHPVNIREINPDIPEWFCNVIDKLMSKQPGDRFGSANEVANLLESCLAHVQQPTNVALPASLIFKIPQDKPWVGALPSFGKYSKISLLLLLLGVGGLITAAWQATVYFSAAESVSPNAQTIRQGSAQQRASASTQLPNEQNNLNRSSREWPMRSNPQPLNDPRNQGAERLRDFLTKTIQIDFTGLTVKQALTQLFDSLDIGYEINARTLRSVESKLDTDCSLVASGDAREILRRLIEPMGVAYIVHESNIEITSLEDSRLRPTIRHFDLAFVLTDNSAAQSLMDTIVQTIDPALWTTNGGECSLTRVNSVLVVSAPESVHQRIEVFLYQLSLGRSTDPER